MDTSNQQLQSIRISNLKKSFMMATHSILTTCSKEDFLRIFSSFKHDEQETLYQLYLQTIASMHENVQDEFESICQESQVMATLGTVEQLIENQQLDVLHEEKGAEGRRTTVNDMKQEAIRRKLSEIDYLKNVLEKMQEQNQIDRKRLESLCKKSDDVSQADSALTKFKNCNEALQQQSQSMNVP
eukprot:Gb_40817 [translate_table: standard]